MHLDILFSYPAAFRVARLICSREIKAQHLPGIHFYDRGTVLIGVFSCRTRARSFGKVYFLYPKYNFESVAHSVR